MIKYSFAQIFEVFTLMNNEKLQNIKFSIIVFFCIAIFGIAIAPRTLQNDTYYTIKIGEYISQNGIGNLKTDPFSMHDNLPYTFPHWGYDLAMYLIYNVGSFDGIYISTIVLAIILGIVMYLLCSYKSKNNVISAVFTILTMYLMKDYIAARAQLVTFILFALTILFIEKFIDKGKKRYIIPLVLIAWIIANVHLAVFPFYFVLYLPYIADYLIKLCWDLNLSIRFYWLMLKGLSKIFKTNQKLINKTNLIEDKMNKISIAKGKMEKNPYKIIMDGNRYIAILIIVFIICGFTGLFTPVGDAPYTYLYKTLIGNTTKSINEHLPLTLIENTNYMLLICSFLGILIFTDTKIKLRDLLMFGGLLYLSFRTRRQISMFLIMCVPILCKMLNDMFNADKSIIILKIKKFATNIFGIIAVMSLVFCISYEVFEPQKDNPYIDAATYPVDASTWIIDNLDVSKIKLFNQYNYGSYLLYRGIPVFIDSRADLYAPEFNTKTGKKEDGKDIFSDALNIDGMNADYNTKFKEYGITHIICYSNARLGVALAQDKDYNMIYQDDYFKIFERISAKEMEGVL